MKIILKCKCGARALYEDSRGSYYIPSDVVMTENSIYLGKKQYYIEDWKNSWLKIHENCLVENKLS